MNLIVLIGKYKNQISWWVLIAFACFLPAILRFVVSMYHNINSFDIKDVLFAGIAFNLANFSIVGIKDFDEKNVILLISLALLIIITSILILYLSDEANKSASIHLVPFVFGASFSFFSGLFNYHVNDFVISVVI